MNIYVKRTLRVLVFIIIFSYLYVHFTYVFREPLSHTREHLMGFYSEKKNTVDVAVIGTSCTFSAIAPMQLWEDHGIAAYDFCTNVMLENTMRYAIREILKTQSPRLFIIDIAPFMNGYGIVDTMDEQTSGDVQVLRYNTDGLRLSKNRFDLINEVVLNRKKRLNYYFDLMFYHSNPEPELKNWNWNMPSAYKGYSNLQVDVMFPDTYEEIETEPCTVSEGEMKILDELLNEIERHNAQVLFIVGPYWPVDDRKEAIGKAEYLKSYLTGRGYAFLDLHEHLDEIGMKGSEDYSMDYNHFTITGAVKNTRYLGDYISAGYDIPDRRNAEGYDKWRREYKEWNEKILPENIEWTERVRQEYIDRREEKKE